jgi:ADP-dependent NAD(P)H-hydrate dehydratase
MNHNLTTSLPSPALPTLPPRAADSHKGDYGSALLIGGSRGMTGAIALAGLSALRGGAGWVRLAVADRCLETVAAYSPCLMTIPLADDKHGRISLDGWDALEPQLSKATCVAIGPGLGQSRELQQLVGRVIEHACCPLVIDADGLNNLAQSSNWSRHCKAPLVITPHPGEWSRLCGVAAGDRDAQCQAAIEFSRETKVIVVLKGRHTLVTDGQTAVWNQTGTPAMAVAGSGDVLTGLITALICQGLGPRDAAHLAVFAHGRAAELAQRELNSHVVLPTELIDHIPPLLAK